MTKTPRSETLRWQATLLDGTVVNEGDQHFLAIADVVRALTAIKNSNDEVVFSLSVPPESTAVWVRRRRFALLGPEVWGWTCVGWKSSHSAQYWFYRDDGQRVIESTDFGAV